MAGPRRTVLSDFHYLSGVADVVEEAQISLKKPISDGEDNELFAEGHPLDHEVVSTLRAGIFPLSAIHLQGEECMKRWKIRREYVRLFKEYADIQAVHDATGFESTLSLMISRLKFPDKIAQHLTVMQLRFPILFRKSLLGAWLAGLLAKELSYSKEQQDLAFQAAILRDLGMMYVHPDILATGNGPKVDTKERNELKQHVLISSELAEGVGFKNESHLLQAIECHHERLDGTGYPGMLKAGDISPVARLIGFCDVVIAIRFKEVSAGELFLEDVSKILLLEQDGFDAKIFSQFHQAVTGKAAMMDDSERKARRVDMLISRAKFIASQMKTITGKLSRPKKANLDRFTPESLAQARKTLRSLARSGHGDPELTWWLGIVAAGKEEADNSQLNEIELQQLEVLRQLERLEDELSSGPMLTHADLQKPQFIG